MNETSWIFWVMCFYSDLKCQVWPHIVRLDCWSWVRIYGDALWTGGHEKHHTTRAQVHRSVDLAISPFLVIWKQSLSVFGGWLCFCVQGILSSHQRESFAVSGLMIPGLWAPTPILQKAVQCRTWKTWWSLFLQTNHRHKYQHLQTTK